MKIIAYLAPEIPALSATFVYNEILALEKRGYAVVPISVHIPSSPVGESRLVDLTNKTHYLYKEGFFSFLLANVQISLCSPLRYLRGLCTVSRDALQVGVCSRTGIGLFYRFFAACRISSILRKEHCEHLHAHFAHVPTDIAMYASSLTGVPFSFTSHANDLFERGWLLPEKIARSKFAATISLFNQKYLIAKGGAPNKIHVVRCGVDSKKFTPSVSQPPTPPYKIGTIGRMVEKKGFNVLLHAASILQKSGVTFQLSIAGDGPLKDDLLKLSHLFDLGEIVKFLGPIANEDVPAWLPTFDLFVLPCQKDANGDMDGIPVVLMEAILSGVPVISTRISGIPELIVHEKGGLLVEPQSATTLAKAMSRLLIDKNLQQRLKENAQRRVNSEFDPNLNIQRLINLFDIDTVYP